MATAQQIIMQYVCPAVGAVLAQFLGLSPLPAVLKVDRSQQLGDLNPLPFAMMAVMAYCWITYACIIRDYFIYTPSVTGLVGGLYYTLVCYKYAPARTQTQLTYLVTAIAAALWAVGIVNMAALHTPAGTQLLWGSTAVASLVLFYSSPMSTLYQVIRTRCSASLYWPLCLMSFIAGSLWCAYGLAIKDWFVTGPNAAGALFNGICLICCLVFPRRGQASGGSGSGRRQGPDHKFVPWSSLRSLGSRACLARSHASAASPPPGSLAADNSTRKQGDSGDLEAPEMGV